jgi:PEP-CTERM motif
VKPSTRLSTVLAALFVWSLGIAEGAPIVLSNATTSLTVNGGEANNGLVPYNGYFQYTDLGAAEETTWSVDPLLVFASGATSVLSDGSTGGFGSPIDLGGGVVRSTASTQGISVQADTQLVGSNARTTFLFSSASDMTGTTLVFYAENDLFGYADDAAAFTGSIAGGDLALFQYDTTAGGLTVRMSGENVANSALSLFGAGIWTAWGEGLEGGDLSLLSSEGSNFATLGDLGLALAFDLSGNTASLVVNYDTQPIPPATTPEPATLGIIALGLAAATTIRRRRV